MPLSPFASYPPPRHGAFCGTDPGLGGAIAVIYGDRQVYVCDVPTIKLKVGRTWKRRVDAKALASLMRFVSGFGIDAGAIEAVNGWSRPKHRKNKGRDDEPEAQSASAAFAFGKVTGQLEQALADHGIPFRSISPALWKRALGLSADKTEARTLAAELFPSAAHLFARVKDDGRAEAVLIAYYLSAYVHPMSTAPHATAN